MRIYVGYVLEIDGEKFEVVGANSIRGKYYYIVKDSAGHTRSLNRVDVLRWNEERRLYVVGDSK